MISMKQKQEIIIRHYRDGDSERKISRELKLNRVTVRRYLKEYKLAREKLKSAGNNDESLKEDVVKTPRYNSENRGKIKLTQEISTEIDRLLKMNEQKRSRGLHKQAMKKIDIFEHLSEKGYDIGYTTICNAIREKENKRKEAFIRQVYQPGDVCEFDWGEVKLEIEGRLQTLYMAVFTPANSNYRYAMLFHRQETASFIQAHVLFFQHIKGVYRTMVYDNMRVAIRRFVGQTEKEPTEALLKLSMYYQFNFRFCNIGKGNEKGHVERNVEFIRRKAFCKVDSFTSVESANFWLQKTCNRLNTRYNRLNNGKKAIDLLAVEKQYLLEPLPPFDCGQMEQLRADKYSVITYMTNRYSVPDHLVSKIIDVKIYPEKLVCYHENNIICSHERRYGSNGWYIELDHYLNTLRVKPGALSGSQAMASAPAEVRKIFEKYFSHVPRDFIELLIFLRDNDYGFDRVTKSIKKLNNICPHNISLDTVKALCMQESSLKSNNKNLTCTGKNGDDQILNHSRKQLDELNMLFN
jgi:transposase